MFSALPACLPESWFSPRSSTLSSFSWMISGMEPDRRFPRKDNFWILKILFNCASPVMRFCERSSLSSAWNNRKHVASMDEKGQYSRLAFEESFWYSHSFAGCLCVVSSDPGLQAHWRHVALKEIFVEVERLQGLQLGQAGGNSSCHVFSGLYIQ